MIHRRTAVEAIALVSSCLAIFGCRPAEAPPPAGSDLPVLVDRAQQLGLDFVHNNGMNGELYMVEMVGAGAALFDLDGDGDLDLYLVDGGRLGPKPPWRGEPANRGRLYLNRLETGSLAFEDVSDRALPPLVTYGQGVITGDVDNDGWIDLYLTNYGPNTLLRNTGEGTLVAVPEAGGAQDDRWSTAAVFVDWDLDGYLDLFASAYIDATIDNHFRCTAHSGIEDYCGPKSFPDLADKLFRNRGDGSFEDVSVASGIGALRGSGLGAVAADLDRDGMPDIYVANDQMENFLWLNRGNGTFANQARIRGVSVNDEGLAEASMGVEAADLDRDGNLDLFLTHLASETNTLYVGRGDGVFSDRTVASRLGPPSLPDTAFGTRAFDLDNDSDLDLIVANGAVHRIEEQLAAGDLLALSQPNRLFINRGDGTFENGEALAPDLRRLRVSRGVAGGDVDNDGDTDIVLTNNNGPVELLINTVGQDRPWLGLDLRLSEAGGRPALGAVARLTLSDGTLLVRLTQTAGSFLSAQDSRILFGLGDVAPPESLEITWPDGGVTECVVPEIGRYSTLTPASEDCHAH